MVANLGKFLTHYRLHYLVMRALFGIDDLWIYAEFFVINVKRNRRIFQDRHGLHNHVITDLSRGADSDFDAIVG